MKERIIEFLKAENKSSAQFAEEIGVQPSGISHIISGRNNPSLDFVMKMLNKYPYLTTDWLLFGKGQMYRGARQIDLFSAENDALPKFDTAERKEDHVVPSAAGSANDSVSAEKEDPEIISGKLKRIVFFFGDGTFKEYRPGL
jgi:transcriptional regulator with XRE-family HTH domain